MEIIENQYLLEKRNKNPYQSLLTSNFLIKKEFLNKVQFDRINSKYGYETFSFYRFENNRI